MTTSVPEWMEPFFNDYKMLLLTPEDITEDKLPNFKSDVGTALYYAKLSSDKKRLKDYLTRQQPELSWQTQAKRSG